MSRKRRLRETTCITITIEKKKKNTKMKKKTESGTRALLYLISIAYTWKILTVRITQNEERYR